MVKNSNDTITITVGELDEIMLLLEATFANTGDSNAFRIIELFMKETNENKIIEHELIKS